MGDYFVSEDDPLSSLDVDELCQMYLGPFAGRPDPNINANTSRNSLPSSSSSISDSSSLPLNDGYFQTFELPQNIILDENSFTQRSIDQQYSSSIFLTPPSNSSNQQDENSFSGQTVDQQYSLSTFLTPPSNSSNQQNDNRLQIIIQPRESFRQRYLCETNRGINGGVLPWRLIQGESGNDQSPSYPTVKIPSYYRTWSQIYIRVTLVTVKTDENPCQFVHPYPIDTPDPSAVVDTSTNSIYFPIYENEFRNEEKSFRIRKIKPTARQLQNYGSLHLFDPNSNASHISHSTTTTITKSRQLVTTYKLNDSRFVFALAKRTNNPPYDFEIVANTSVESRTMSEKNKYSQQTTSQMNEQVNRPTVNVCHCTPNKGEWSGGQCVIIVLSNAIETIPTIDFDFGPYGSILAMDTKLSGPTIIVFNTPPCPYSTEYERIIAKIHIRHDQIVHPPIDFEYIAPIEQIVAKRLRENEDEVVNKRVHKYVSHIQKDSADNLLVNSMSQLTIQKQPTRSTSIDDGNLKRYLSQLKQALDAFIRTNNPSQLFRRTRILIVNELTNSLLLHDTITNGRTETVISLIEQIIDLSASKVLFEEVNQLGETPLLVAAKFNQIQIVECILKKRSEYAEQTDKNGNNLFHLLASLKNDEGLEMIEKLLLILSDEISMKLLKQKNLQDQTPMNIAKSSDNTSVLSVLSF